MSEWGIGRYRGTPVYSSLAPIIDTMAHDRPGDSRGRPVTFLRLQQRSIVLLKARLSTIWISLRSKSKRLLCANGADTVSSVPQRLWHKANGLRSTNIIKITTITTPTTPTASRNLRTNVRKNETAPSMSPSWGSPRFHSLRPFQSGSSRVH